MFKLLLYLNQKVSLCFPFRTINPNIIPKKWLTKPFPVKSYIILYDCHTISLKNIKKSLHPLFIYIVNWISVGKELISLLNEA